MERDLGAVNVGFDRANGIIDDELHAHGGREMENGIALADGGIEDGISRHVTVDSREFGICFAGFQIVRLSGGEVVPHDDFVTSGKKVFGQMRADKAGPAGDEITHRSPREFCVSGNSS